MRKGIALLILAAFIAQTCVPYAHAQQMVNLPAPGMRLELSQSFAPQLLKGIKIYSNDPFRLDFILDRGDETGNDADRLIKYFLASLTVPEKDLWVNLSPYEKDRITPDAFGSTEMGRDLLAQDYILKQVTASLLYPEGEVGKEFWAKIYQQAQEKFGTIDIPVDTFNKVWIVPQKATVFENKDAAFVVESRLKVMLESDYLAASKADAPDIALAKDVLRSVVIPVLEKEINEGKNFTQLRQVYYSLILATWFKDKVKQTILGQSYVDQQKIAGVDIADKAEKEKIWAQYVEAFKKGVFNFVKEEKDPPSGDVVPRKYFSGGAEMGLKNVFKVDHAQSSLPKDFAMGRSDIIQFKGEPVVLSPRGTSLDMEKKLRRIITGWGSLDLWQPDPVDLKNFKNRLERFRKEENTVPISVTPGLKHYWYRLPSLGTEKYMFLVNPGVWKVLPFWEEGIGLRIYFVGEKETLKFKVIAPKDRKAGDFKISLVRRYSDLQAAREDTTEYLGAILNQAYGMMDKEPSSSDIQVLKQHLDQFNQTGYRFSSTVASGTWGGEISFMIARNVEMRFKGLKPSTEYKIDLVWEGYRGLRIYLTGGGEVVSYRLEKGYSPDTVYSEKKSLAAGLLGRFSTIAEASNDVRDHLSTLVEYDLLSDHMHDKRSLAVFEDILADVRARGLVYETGAGSLNNGQMYADFLITPVPFHYLRFMQLEPHTTYKVLPFWEEKLGLRIYFVSDKNTIGYRPDIEVDQDVRESRNFSAKISLKAEDLETARAQIHTLEYLKRTRIGSRIVVSSQYMRLEPWQEDKMTAHNDVESQVFSAEVLTRLKARYSQQEIGWLTTVGEFVFDLDVSVDEALRMDGIPKDKYAWIKEQWTGVLPGILKDLYAVDSAQKQESAADQVGKYHLQARGDGFSEGLLDLEDHYNRSRVVMRTMGAITGAALGAVGAGLATLDLQSMFLGGALGAAVFAGGYSLLFPKVKYGSIDSGVNILDAKKSDEDVLLARGEFIEGLARADSPLAVRVGLSGLEECDRLLMGSRDEKYSLAFPPQATALAPEFIKQVESNLASLHLDGLIKVVIHDNFPYLSVSSILPNEAQRQTLRAMISNEENINRIFDHVVLDHGSEVLLKGMVWYGLLDLLYRQDGSGNFTQEHNGLYQNNSIFNDPDVLRPLADDQLRPQEDYLVSLIQGRMDPSRPYRMLVFATGSGALINNMLKKIPNISQVVEYDASPVSNKTADMKRRSLLPEGLYKKVKQVTADVRDFEGQLRGEKFDFIVSTASLRLMSEGAMESVLDFLKKGSALNEGGQFIYMDTVAHKDLMDHVVQGLGSSGMRTDVHSREFAGHRDTMFYVFVHEYARNPNFKDQVQKMMSLQQKDDLHAFLYEMAGLRTIHYDVLSATHAAARPTGEDFGVFARRLTGFLEPLFRAVFGQAVISVEKGPSSKMTIRLLGKDPETQSLNSYDITVRAMNGLVGRMTIYDGRSIGVNTLIIGRLLLQDPGTSPVIVTQHILTSRYGYENVRQDLRLFLQKILPENFMNLSADTEVDAFAQALVGLSEHQIFDVVHDGLQAGQAKGQILQALKNAPRGVYPSQEHSSFNGAGKVFLDTVRFIDGLARDFGYDSVSGIVSLPDGFQNLVLYQKFGYAPVISKGDDSRFDVFMKVLTESKGASLKDASWKLSQSMQEQMLVLLRKPLGIDGMPGLNDRDIDNAESFNGGIDLTRDKMNVEVKTTGDGVQFNFDPQTIAQWQNASGVTPVIIDIHPMTTSLPVFLGINEAASAVRQGALK